MVMMTTKKEGKIKLEVEFEVRDRYGRLISKYKQTSKSFVRNFLKLLRAYMATTLKDASLPSDAGWKRMIGNHVGSADPNALKDQGNTSSDLWVAWGVGHQSTDPTVFYFGGLDAVAGDASYGLIAGSSDQAVSVDDYHLIAKYGEGNGSGQLAHGAVTVENVSVAGAVTKFRIIRTFTNNYGSTQTVKEVGLLYKAISDWNISGGNIFPMFTMYLISRDVPASAQAIPSGATLTVRATISTTV